MKEILPFVTTQINPEGIMLSEMSDRERENSAMFSFTCGIQKS